jgi:hypothetical protein
MMRLTILVLAVLAAVQVAAAELGDDGLHKAPWMRDTFKDLSEDLAEANAEGKRLLLLIEQRGCIYCTRMHQEVFVLPEAVAEGATASQAAVVTMPGAFEKGTTLSLLTWVVEHGYEGDEPFQKYLARKLGEGNG